MKLIIREYIESLREREELDAILPDLLSELGFNVYSRPGRGTTQHGVDIAAVRQDEDGEKRVYLFSVKQGDLTRVEWNNNAQSLRPSLEDIIDTYIPTRIPTELKKLKVVICLVFGGDIKEQVRASVTGFRNSHTTKKISFEEWNGDKIAELLLKGLLRERLLPKTMQSAFQKSVAMVDEPDVAYLHFEKLTSNLCDGARSSDRARVRSARQIYICLWILYVWARDIDNIEAPYRISELALLQVWNLYRPYVGKKNATANSLVIVIDQLLKLHMIIATNYLETKIFPHVKKKHALSNCVASQSSVDVNLKMFDLLGRIAMTGIWYKWIAAKFDMDDPKIGPKFTRIVQNGFDLINNNPSLLTPLCDHQAIEIALFILMSIAEVGSEVAIAGWLKQIADRMDFAYRVHGKYPCVYTNYRDLIEHPRERTDEYRKDATSGSTLIPLLAAWLAVFKDNKTLGELANLYASEMDHCTLQLWVPDKNSEDKMYLGGHDHGLAVTDLKLSSTGKELLETIAEVCKNEQSLSRMSAVKADIWPLILLACRHYRHPIPPQFWIDIVHPPSPVSASAVTT